MQRMPQSSTRPSASEALRWMHSSSSTPTLPSRPRKTTKSSPRRRWTVGAQPGSGNRSDVQIGTQKRRNSAPIGVPGPIRQSRSFSSRVIMSYSPHFLSVAFPWGGTPRPPSVFPRRLPNDAACQSKYLPWKTFLGRYMVGTSLSCRACGKVSVLKIARIVDRIDRPVVFCPELTTPIRKQGMPRKKTALPSDHAKDIAKTWAKERPELDPLDYLLPIYLLRIARIVERSADQRARRSFGISSAELRVLLALRRAGGNYSRRPTDLFRALLVTSGAITKN